MSVAVIKHSGQKKLRGERVYSAYNSRSQSIILEMSRQDLEADSLIQSPEQREMGVHVHCTVHILCTFTILDQAQGSILLIFRVSLPTSVDPIKRLPHLRTHRATMPRQSLTETLPTWFHTVSN